MITTTITRNDDSFHNDDIEVNFAKLQGKDFKYYMQTYSIILGRNSKTCIVDVDLSNHGGGKNISRYHVCIFFDFTRHHYSLEVLGKNGCLVQDIPYLPGNPPVKLDSQDLIQIGDIKLHFMLPMRRPFGPQHCPQHMVMPIPVNGSAFALNYNYHLAAAAAAATEVGIVMKKGKRNYCEHDDDDVDGSSVKKSKMSEFEDNSYGGVRSGGKDLLVRGMDKKSKGRSQIDEDANNLQLLKFEEENVVSSAATVLSHLSGHGQWMRIEKLHAELVKQYSNIWQQKRVKKYLTSEDWPGAESKGKPWVHNVYHSLMGSSSSGTCLISLKQGLGFESYG
ncbi:unnamed protein product [Lupinus luteus]|uniref:FHA domain-containing protein n=1 Tax=Lupinus luteus TaxID=3873 RepID=A0AAV1W5E7_LUPLU